LFSNFADGMLMSNNKERLVLNIWAATFQIVEYDGTFVMTKGSNFITGTGLDLAFTNAGGNWYGFIADAPAAGFGNSIFTSYKYALYDVTPTTARLSDYAYRNASATTLYKLVYTGLQSYSAIVLTTLNTMHDAEVVFNSNILSGETDKCLLLFAGVGVMPSGTFGMLTRTIDTAFNETPVSFDSLIEVELTNDVIIVDPTPPEPPVHPPVADFYYEVVPGTTPPIADFDYEVVPEPITEI
jgi:hypothetical protein